MRNKARGNPGLVSFLALVIQQTLESIRVCDLLIVLVNNIDPFIPMLSTDQSLTTVEAADGVGVNFSVHLSDHDFKKLLLNACFQMLPHFCKTDLLVGKGPTRKRISWFHRFRPLFRFWLWFSS